MNKKYKLTDETIMYYGRELHRIEALSNFSDVEIGQKGGFVESENNLSQVGNCWIYNNAKVFDRAVVSEDASIYDNAIVCGYAEVYGNAEVATRAKVKGYAKVYGDAYIGESSSVVGKAQVFDYAFVEGNAIIRDNARVYGHADIDGNSIIMDYAEIYDNATVIDMSFIFGKSKVSNNVVVSGNAMIRDAIIKEKTDYIIFKNWWSSGRHFTWTKSNNMWSVGCFYGTGEELIAKAYNDSELSGREYERIVKYVESITNEKEI